MSTTDKESWYRAPVMPVSAQATKAARERQGSLTKPPGSLGMLEDIAVSFSGWQNTDRPRLEHIQIIVFAGDHGIATSGVSAFPQQVTLEMIRNFSRGGAAICVLADEIGANFSVTNLGTATVCEELSGVSNLQLAFGTDNFLHGPAMSEDLCLKAMMSGKEQIMDSADLFVGGEMGIGNTSSAAALICSMTGEDAKKWVGRGTGLEDSALEEKIRLIQQALDQCQSSLDSPFECLRYFGGLEIAALVGSYIACAQKGIPVLVDGFITTAAALIAIKLNPGSLDWMLFSHRSEEQGHQKLLELMRVNPLVNFDMRLGEGSGAAIVIPILRSACRLQSEMATFEQAQVSQ